MSVPGRPSAAVASVTPSSSHSGMDGALPEGGSLPRAGSAVPTLGRLTGQSGLRLGCWGHFQSPGGSRVQILSQHSRALVALTLSPAVPVPRVPHL